jgi:hypothetical protein
LQFDELCADVLSRKLASGEVEGCANVTMRRERGLIAVSALLGGRGGMLLCLLWLWLLSGWGKVGWRLVMLVRLVRERVHG